MSEKGEQAFAFWMAMVLGAGFVGLGLWYLFTPGKILPGILRENQASRWSRRRPIVQGP